MLWQSSQTTFYSIISILANNIPSHWQSHREYLPTMRSISLLLVTALLSAASPLKNTNNGGFEIDVQPRDATLKGWTAGYCAEGPGQEVFNQDGERIMALRDTNTPEACLTLCHAESFDFAGLTNGNECWCSHNFRQYPPPRTSDFSCREPCSGDDRLHCGGRGTTMWYGRSDAISVSVTLVLSDVHWRHPMCLTNRAPPDQLLPHLVTIQEQNLPHNEPEACSALCLMRGFRLAGLEGPKCYCGNDIQDPLGQVSRDECTVGCLGDPTVSCGGPGRTLVYEYRQDLVSLGGAGNRR